MNRLARMAFLMAGLSVADAAGQGVALPPLGRAGPPRVDILPPPTVEKPTVEKPLGDPPRLGLPLEAGAPVGAEVTAAPLRIEEVLASVDAFYPAIRIAEQERALAEANQVSSRGAFDVVLRSQELFTSGTYDNQRYSLGIEQASPMMGASYFAGYRLGSGAFPVYYGDRKTGEGGEFRAGAMLPLLRGRDIDRARAGVAKADIDRSLAEPNIHLARLDIGRAAARAYWGWAAAGQRYLVARDVLDLARRRDDQLGKRVAAGNLARIEQEDNRRVIVEREARLVTAFRGVQQAAFALGLYYRGPDGRPCPPPLTRLPLFAVPLAPPDEAGLMAAIEEAMTRRPEVRRLALMRQKTLVDIQLAENQTLPGVNLIMAAARDTGAGLRSPQSTSLLARETYEAGVVVDVPLQRREARGRILAGRAELARLAAAEQLARDRISLEVQDAASAMERAHDLLRRGRDNRLQASYIEEAERRLFEIGKSDLFRVNIRELTAAEARLLELEAAAEFYRAAVDYAAALGLDPTTPTR